MKKRGQVAMEFIMTYGWAILVVLVAIGALAYFGVLNPSKYLPEKCVFTTGVTCRDFILQESGTDLVVRFNLENGLGESMTIGAGNISALYKSTTVGCTPDAGAGAITIQSELSEGFTCTFTGDSPGEGASAKVAVSLNYTTATGVYGKRAVGDLSGTVQG